MAKPIQYVEEEVIQAATKVFWKKGFHGTSIQDLVEVTGLNRSSIYNGFIDKENLFVRCLIYYREHFEKFDTNDSIDAIEIIKQYLDDLVNHIYADYPTNGSMLSNTTAELGNRNEKIKSFLARNKRLVEFQLNKLVLEAQENGDISRSISSKTIAHYLFTVMQGLCITSMIVQDSAQLKEVIDITIFTLKNC